MTASLEAVPVQPNETCGPGGFHYLMPREVAKPLGLTGNVVEERVLEPAPAGTMSLPGRKEHP